jgi:repressor LexA
VAERLSDQQKRVLTVIRERVVRDGFPPTVREIGLAVGLGSPSSVNHHLNVLRQHGYISRTTGPRTIRLEMPAPADEVPGGRAARNAGDSRGRNIGEDRGENGGWNAGQNRGGNGREDAGADADRNGGGSDVRVPLVGTIAAGQPIVADELVEDWLTLPVGMTGRGTLFALRVRGDSMVDAAICDGDVVVVRQQPVAESGDIVAALLGQDATVKKYRRQDGHVQLVPCNPAYSVIPGDEAVVLGKVTCVIRRL